jgi:hypothetical protein
MSKLSAMSTPNATTTQGEQGGTIEVTNTSTGAVFGAERAGEARRAWSIDCQRYQKE